MLLGTLIPLFAYFLLPAVGVTQFESLFSLNKLLKLFILAFGGIGYVGYIIYLYRQPQLLVYFYILAWPVVEFINNVLLFVVGINLHLRPILMLAIGLPGLVLTCKHFGKLREVPHFKYYLAFWLWLLFYFLFFNSHAVSPGDEMESVWSEGSIGIAQFTSYFYCLVGIGLTGVNMLQNRNPQQFFDNINRKLLWLTGFLALITLIGYPFGFFAMKIDGFQRAIGIFTHPNPFSHHMGILLLYLMGLFGYYQSRDNQRIPFGLLISSLSLNLFAFLLGMSKTAIAVFLLAGAVYFLLSLSSAHIRKLFFRLAMLMLIIVPIGILMYQIITQESFFDILQARIEQQASLDWRYEVWDGLILNLMENGSYWLGNGFTAANAWVFQLTYHDKLNAAPLMLVHNGYISLIYDLGILGWLIFVSAISLMLNSLRRAWSSHHIYTKPLLNSVIAMGIYFLAVCAFDEMTYMFDAPMLFFVLATLTYTFSRRERLA